MVGSQWIPRRNNLGDLWAIGGGGSDDAGGDSCRGGGDDRSVTQRFHLDGDRALPDRGKIRLEQYRGGGKARNAEERNGLGSRPSRPTRSAVIGPVVLTMKAV